MSFEESQYQLRREKLKQIEALGQQSYPRKFEFTHSIPEIVAKYSDFTCEQLDPDRVNVRGGPTRDNEVMFVYTRAGLPVEITAESDNWRRIRDWEGSEGWVYHSLLSGRRTAVVTPKEKKELVPLYDKGDSNAPVIARLQAGVLAGIKRCTGSWCRIVGPGFDGWTLQEQLWGVYPNEKVE